jgi:hypothetical protein
MMRLSVVVLLVGMLAGIVMGIQPNLALGPAHAHLDVDRCVLLFLFGRHLQTGSICGGPHQDGLDGNAASASPCHFLRLSVA